MNAANETAAAPDRKAAVVGVVGRTNAGKSSLVNALVGEKVTIVSQVEQTTRNTVRGIVDEPRGLTLNFQLGLSFRSRDMKVIRPAVAKK